MAGKYSGSKEEEWEVACMCRFYRLEQIQPERPFPMPQID